MANLGAHQKISRVIPNKPFGDGSAGNATIGADPNTRATVTGTAGGAISTLGTAILSNGDVALLIQSQGTGVGQYEIVKVLSGGGTTSITWTTNLQNTYGAGAQCVKISLYDVVTVNTFTPSGWNGSIGGVVVIAAKTSITVNGAINGNGLGYRGGAGVAGGTAYGNYAEGVTAGSGNSGNPNNNTSGGGGGKSNDPNVSNGSGGGGGGHAATGAAGGRAGGGVGGTGGTSQGAADLTSIFFGGGGGGGGGKNTGPTTGGNGGPGGGVIIFISPIVTLSAAANASGNNGANGVFAGTGTSGGGGGGAGGSIQIQCTTATLGTNQATAIGGTEGSSNYTPSVTSAGRISVHHAGAVTGTTNPTFNDTTDATLVQVTGGGLLTMFVG